MPAPTMLPVGHMKHNLERESEREAELVSYIYLRIQSINPLRHTKTLKYHQIAVLSMITMHATMKVYIYMPILTIPWLPFQLFLRPPPTTPAVSEKPTSTNYWKRDRKDKSKEEAMISYTCQTSSLFSLMLFLDCCCVLCCFQYSALVVWALNASMRYFQTRA